MKLIFLIVTILVAVNDILGSYIENLQEKQSNDGLSDQIPQVFAGAFAISLGLSLLPSSINVISSVLGKIKFLRKCVLYISCIIIYTTHFLMFDTSILYFNACPHKKKISC